MDTARAELQQRLTVQGEGFRDRVGAVGRVDGVTDDLQTVRVGHFATAPGTEIFSVAAEHDDRRVLALKDVDAVLLIGRHPADHPEGLPGGQFEEVADHLVGIFTGADLCHFRFPPKKS
jgi:hypothetical protein